MPYSAKADIQKKVSDATLAQLTDNDDGINIDDTKITQAITDADDLIDTYLRARYTVPFSDTTDLIKKISVDIAIFELYSGRPEDEIPETVKLRYQENIKLLEKIAKGEISLGAGSEDTAEPARFKSNKSPEDREFGKDVLDTYC